MTTLQLCALALILAGVICAWSLVNLFRVHRDARKLGL